MYTKRYRPLGPSIISWILFFLIVGTLLVGLSLLIISPANATDIDPTPSPTATEQPQLCEEQIGRRIDMDDKAYVVISVDENCDPVLELINEDSPLWDCTTMGNRECGVLIDGTWWIIHYDENGCEVSRNIRELYPNGVPTEQPTPVEPVVEPTDEPVVVPEAPAVVEIADVAPEPKQPELAETGLSASWVYALIAMGLIVIGTVLMNLPTWLWIRRTKVR